MTPPPLPAELAASIRHACAAVDCPMRSEAGGSCMTHGCRVCAPLLVVAHLGFAAGIAHRDGQIAGWLRNENKWTALWRNELAGMIESGALDRQGGNDG